jgi:hypothetical protein
MLLLTTEDINQLICFIDDGNKGFILIEDMLSYMKSTERIRSQADYLA